jgi:hypothetical protein
LQSVDRVDNENVGRLGSFVAVALTALAFASAAPAKPLLGVLGNGARFETLTGQKSTVRLAFLGWGQGLSYGSSFVPLFKTLGPIPMIHLNTTVGGTKKEAVTPAQIAAGKGDGYLVALNHGISQYGGGIYVRPMAEMNNSGNAWSAYTSSGAPKAGHSTADYRKAFARIYLILHGGSATTISAKLKKLGMPGIAQDLPSNPFPHLRVVWNPLAGGSPRVAGNAAQNYYPGRAYVDVEGVDIYDEATGAPWQAVDDLYRASVSHGRPFSIPEFGLINIDDGAFVTKACAFLKSHPRVEEASFYEGNPGGPFDIATKPNTKKVYTSCIPLLGAPLPAWANASSSGGGTTTSSGATVTFTAAGSSIGSVSAPIGADEIEVNITPATGVIGSAFWIRNGKALAKMTIPDGATGLVFTTAPGGAAPTPIIRPRAGTDFHVKWGSSGALTSAWWTRVGKLLAQIPLTSGQTSIAMTQGS